MMIFLTTNIIREMLDRGVQFTVNGTDKKGNVYIDWEENEKPYTARISERSKRLIIAQPLHRKTS
jgi:hypothetical protein